MTYKLYYSPGSAAMAPLAILLEADAIFEQAYEEESREGIGAEPGELSRLQR